MAEKLFRWNGTQWVPVTDVTRIEVKVEGGGGMIMADIEISLTYMDLGLPIPDIDKPS